MPPTYRTMQGIVYDTIREAIFEGRYPPGQRLVADDLAREMGVSRMPVREALHRLEASGLVAITPHKGAVVSALSETEVAELYHIRAVLDGLAARLAAPNLTVEDFERLARILDDMDLAVVAGDVNRVLRVNRDFHAVIWQATRAPRLQELLSQLYDASERFRNLSVLLPSRLERLTGEHRRIVQALADGDVEQAERFAKEHHESTATRLLQSIEVSEGDVSSKVSPTT